MALRGIDPVAQNSKELISQPLAESRWGLHGKRVLIAVSAGVAAYVKLYNQANKRKIKVYGVQSEHAAAYPPSLKAGKPVEIQTTPTIADGISVGKPGKVPFELIRKNI
ncbi:MAG: pyridoxal-phosphate dependent enzyme, partial [Oxalobacteraceae bacterium]|nr:pyridoxal-phosphate dependent enzyme [Oxalobacteraceae bacterium]